MDKVKFKTRIGGQAVIEGIAMKGPQKTCLAVRLPDGSIKTELFDTKRSSAMKIPFVRGSVAMVGSMIEGMKYINKSADYAYPDEAAKEKKNDSSFVTIVGGLLGTLLAVALFVMLPTFLTGTFSRYVADLGVYKTVVEGAIKLLFFVGYLFLVTRLKEIHRVFEYHGAEHKTIFCYEGGMELTPANAAKCSRFHPRCGTSFIFVVILISLIVFSFVPWGSTVVRALLKLAALPIIMGIAYEVIQLCGRHDNLLTRILAAPGLWMQRLTTFEPDESELEVAITALKAVLPDNQEDAKW